MAAQAGTVEEGAGAAGRTWKLTWPTWDQESAGGNRFLFHVAPQNKPQVDRKPRNEKAPPNFHKKFRQCLVF